MLDFSNDSHRRYNPLTGEWVLVSPHRAKRPWQGRTEDIPPDNRPSYDPDCYLCPGNTRANGEVNDQYTSTFVFTNDFAALPQEGPLETYEAGLLRAKGERGICRVVCFSPDHSLTIPDMSIESLEKVISLWQEEYASLGAKDFINHVQIFENKGSLMGCSNPHPHGQIWAQSSIPLEASKKTENQQAYWAKHKRSLLQDYLAQELEKGTRIIYENEGFVSLIPFWAIWPYEAMIIAKRHIQHIGQLTDAEKTQYASCLKDLTQRYDRLFNTSFPYSSGVCQQPTDGKEYPGWHFHMAFYPPLLRSATVRKFMVGYEMFGEPQRDISAETAAATLRSK